MSPSVLNNVFDIILPIDQTLLQCGVMPNRSNHLATAAVVASAGLMLCVGQAVALPLPGSILQSDARPAARHTAEEERETVEQLVQSLEEALLQLSELQQQRHHTPHAGLARIDAEVFSALLAEHAQRPAQAACVSALDPPQVHLLNLPPPVC